MTIVFDTTLTPCAVAPDVYHDDHLHNPPARNDISAAEWDLVAAKRADAHRRCAGCPLMVDCLYRAVVEVDVSGFVACTTEVERKKIRRQLGIKVQHRDSGPYGAPRVGSGPLSLDAVMTARISYPNDSCQQLAERLSCSSSTIKRHLKRAREEQVGIIAARLHTSARPSVDAVLDCFDNLESSKVA